MNKLVLLAFLTLSLSVNAQSGPGPGPGPQQHQFGPPFRHGRPPQMEVQRNVKCQCHCNMNKPHGKKMMKQDRPNKGHQKPEMESPKEKK